MDQDSGDTVIAAETEVTEDQSVANDNNDLPVTNGSTEQEAPSDPSAEVAAVAESIVSRLSPDTNFYTQYWLLEGCQS